MNICITGALGHIGSSLIRSLSIKSLGKVYLVDNMLTQRYCSLFNLPDGINFNFREMDINSQDIEPLIEDSDVVVHLAAITNAEASFNNPKDVERVNRQGSENIARLCAKYGRKLVFPSTTSVYGSQSEVVDELCAEAELKPQSPYADSKLQAEKFLCSLGAEKKLKFVILRLGTIFGYSVGMRFHTAVNKFIWQAAAGEEITVWRTALNQKRPYLGLRDCVKAINYILEADAFDCEIYNIVTTNLTVQDIINVIKAYIPDIKVKFVDSAIMNQLSYCVSNKKSLQRGFVYKEGVSDSIRESLSKLRNINFCVKKEGLE